MAVDNPPYREPMLALRHAMTVRPATPLAMPYRSDKHLGKHTCASSAGGRITGKISVRNCSRMQDASQAETERDGRKDRDITKDRI